MRLTKKLLCGFSALALAGSVFASESASYERSDPAFNYSELSELERFDAIEPSSSESMASSEQLESDVIWVYPVETIVLVPSIDTETPLGGG